MGLVQCIEFIVELLYMCGHRFELQTPEEYSEEGILLPHCHDYCKDKQFKQGKSILQEVRKVQSSGKCPAHSPLSPGFVYRTSNLFVSMVILNWENHWVVSMVAI